jgi:hypothetical protein
MHFDNPLAVSHVGRRRNADAPHLAVNGNFVGSSGTHKTISSVGSRLVPTRCDCDSGATVQQLISERYLATIIQAETPHTHGDYGRSE